ncbi:hypothetical protein AWE51_23925 [Aquimarina aggregata]|uniref:CHAT domain-containing protein n=1 Tax=Aquimarina aggregata TaxID=1642818 RepID=A0A162CRB9_9FLAO|nr:CHAT domain-containing protein [Aquimarina aggregata]KZS41004.1 hypothetical protein AWE51_23925 [Aquimarina aggregata]
MTCYFIFFNTIVSYSQTTDTLVAYQHFVKADSLLTNKSYEESIKYFKKALPIYKKAKAWERVARCYNRIAENLQHNYELEKSLQNAKEALTISNSYLQKENKEKAYVYDNMGKYYNEKEDFEKALKFYSKALSIRQRLLGKEHIDIATSYSNLALTYYHTSLYKKAIEYHNKALVINLNTLGADHQKIGNTYNNIGIVYKRLGNYKRALYYFEKDLKITIKNSGEHHLYASYSYNNIGLIYAETKQNDKAIAYYQRALSILIQEDNIYGMNILYNNIGNLLDEKGEFDEALEYYKKSLNMRLKLYGDSHSEIGTIYNNIGVTYINKSDYKNALRYFSKALKVFKSLYKKNHYNIAFEYANLGSVYIRKKEYDNALKYYKKALKIYKAIDISDQIDIADVYLNIAIVYSKKEEYTNALLNSEKSLKILQNKYGEKHSLAMESYLNIAEIYNKRKKHVKAISYYDTVLLINTKNVFKKISKNTFDSNYYYDQKLLLKTLTGKARSFLFQYKKSSAIKDLKEAILTYQKIDTLINTVRHSYTNYNDKVTFAKKTAKIYQGAIASHLLAYKVTKDQKSLEKAFYYSEKSKANTLKELLAAANATNYAGLPKEVLELEKELRIDQAFYQSKITEERTKQRIDSSKIIDYENRLFDISKRQDSLTMILEKEYPKYHQLKHKNALVSVSDIQQKLKANTTLLEFFVSDNIVYAFTISKDKLDVKEITVSDVSKNIEILKESIIAKDIQEYKKVAYGLYSQLIAPIQDRLTGGDELIIVPDGALWHCNFELLLTQQDSSNNPKSLSYLLKEFAISYANSASLLFQSSNTKSVHQEKEDCLAFSFSNSTTVIDAKTMSLATLRNAGDDLPGTRREIREISEIIDGQYYFGSQAIESNFKRNANRYNILHLALHGDVDHKRPENSKLYFTKSKDTIDDNLLYAHELFAMDIPAELTVLSACNTGTGKVAKGEGIMSLGSAFQYAGTKSLLLSSWAVSDQTTPELMKYFYTNLKEGMNKSKALQQAKLQYLQTANLDRVHPWYWGGFYVVGDTTAIQFTSNTSWYWILGIVLFVLILARFVYKRNSNKTKKLSYDI